MENISAAYKKYQKISTEFMVDFREDWHKKHLCVAYLDYLGKLQYTDYTKETFDLSKIGKKGEYIISKIHSNGSKKEFGAKISYASTMHAATGPKGGETIKSSEDPSSCTIS